MDKNQREIAGSTLIKCDAKAGANGELILQKKVKAIVTAPINKEATIQAGYGDVGPKNKIKYNRASQYPRVTQVE